MSEEWKKWEGQTIDGKFLLRQFLGSADHSVVFLTQLSDPQPKDAAIKFLVADGSTEETRLALWKRAAHLSHPNLLGIFDCGRCRLGENNLLYVVMEYAEENLGEILPQRALTADEVRDFLNPALDALVYLHAKGLAHGHLKPSNLLATQDCLKLSSDTMFSIGEKAVLQRSTDIYDAPELLTAPLSAKADAWSLGVTLVEALTQQTPLLAAQPASDPPIAETLPEPFREIARHALRRSEHQRWSVGEIAARLNPAPLAAAAAMASAGPAATLSPLSVPLAAEQAVPLAKLPAAPEAPVRRNTPPAKTRRSSPFDYFIPALLGAAVIIGLIFAVPKIFHFQGQAGSSPASANSEPSASSGSAAPSDAAPAKVGREETPRKSPERTAAASITPAPAVMRTDPTPAPRAKTAGEVVGRGEVLNEVLPKPPEKALSTIRGTLHVVVKVQVDAAGNVSDAELDSPGPSRYFAGLAEKAARQWQFSGAEANGHGIPSTWLIRFDFSSGGAHANAQQTEP